jgi:CheY-like chemotaxis protein
MNAYTILLVEDQEEMSAMIVATLELKGYHVVTAANGREVEKALAAHAVDLVLTDLLMPEKDGIEVMSDLRHDRPELPIIAMSGGGAMPASFYLHLARNFGAKTVLLKPFTEELLLAEIGKLLPSSG